MEIRTRQQGDTPFFPNMLNNGKVEVCLKEDVDAALAAKDAELRLLREDALATDKAREKWFQLAKKQSKEIAELKAAIESEKASRYADGVDAGMRERRLQRMLWISRAKRAIEKIAWFKLWNASISTMNPEDGARQEYDKWKKNLGKFLKKAEKWR